MDAMILNAAVTRGNHAVLALLLQALPGPRSDARVPAERFYGIEAWFRMCQHTEGN